MSSKKLQNKIKIESNKNIKFKKKNKKKTKKIQKKKYSKKKKKPNKTPDQTKPPKNTNITISQKKHK